METIFTKHSLLQMKERKIERVWVEETIKHPDKVEKEGGNKYYASKRLNGLTIEVVYIKEKLIKIITVYPLL